MNIAMWVKALRVIPRISKTEWKALDVISKWLIASRSAVFIMTVFSAVIGGLLALSDGKFEIYRFIICLLGLILAHATNNLINDLTDSLRGVDKDNYFRTMYGPQTIEHGLWSIKQIILAISITGFLAVFCGIILIFMSGINILWLMLAGSFFVLFYTWPLKNIGLGELSVLIVWGPLMIGGAYLAITGVWSWQAAFLGLIYAIGPTTVLLGKHTDKLNQDALKQIRTLPVILGESNSRLLTAILIIIQPIIIVLLSISGVINYSMLIMLMSMPVILDTVKIFMKKRPTERPDNFPSEVWPTYLSAYAFVCNKTTGSLFILGLIIGLFIK